VFLAERKLADGPDLGVRLQLLLDRRIESACLHGDDFRRCVGVVRDWAAAFRAEDSVHSFAGAAQAGVALGGALEGELVFGDDGDERVGRSRLALAIIAVIVTDKEWLIDIDAIGNCFAETVAGDRHFAGG